MDARSPSPVRTTLSRRRWLSLIRSPTFASPKATTVRSEGDQLMIPAHGVYWLTDR